MTSPLTLRVRQSDIATYYLVDYGLPSEEDPNRVAYVKFRLATQAQNEARAALTAEASRIYRPELGIYEVKQVWNIEEQRRLEVFLTMADCNLELQDDNDPEKFFRAFTFAKSNGVLQVAMTQEDFANNWGKLPASFCEAIHKACIAHNKHWNPNSNR